MDDLVSICLRNKTSEKVKHGSMILLLSRRTSAGGTLHESNSSREASATKNKVFQISKRTAMLCALSTDPNESEVTLNLETRTLWYCNYSAVGHKQSLHYCPCHKRKCVPLISHCHLSLSLLVSCPFDCP